MARRCRTSSDVPAAPRIFEPGGRFYFGRDSPGLCAIREMQRPSHRMGGSYGAHTTPCGGVLVRNASGRRTRCDSPPARQKGTQELSLAPPRAQDLQSRYSAPLRSGTSHGTTPGGTDSHQHHRMRSDHDSAESAELEQRMQEASLLADEGHWEEAFALLLEEEHDHPDNAMLLCMLGVAARAVDADGPAYQYFRRCLAQSPTDPVLLATAGSALAALGEPEAESALRLAALTAPDLPLARLQYGAYLAREGMLDVGTAELEAARLLDESNADIRLELAVAYLLAGRNEDGVAEMEEALSRNSEDSWIRLLYGLALLEARRTEQAAEELHRAAADRVDDSDAQLVSALASTTQGWTDEAWNAFARAEATDAADPGLLEEVEASIEAGAEEAEALLSGYLAPSVLRTRLLERP